MPSVRPLPCALTAIALFAGALVPSPAQAAYTATTTVNTANAEVVSFKFDGVAHTAYATAFQTSLANPNGTAAGGPFNTYCVDISGELTGKQSVNVGAISSLAGGYGNYVGSLYASFAAQATTAVQQAALQLAIWKTEYDGPTINNTGHFVLTAASQAVIDQAVSYMQNNKLISNNVSYLQVVSGTAGQSLVGPAFSTSTVSPNNQTNPAAVPEPASLTLMGIGLAASLGLARRRRPASA